MNPTAQQWIEQAEYDLGTASAMLTSGRYLYVLYCCQQAVEKTLKSMIVAKTGEFPPRVHSLPWLAEMAKLELDPLRAGFLTELSGYYIQTRYPEAVEAIRATATQPLAKTILARTEELMTWLRSMKT